MNEYDDRLRVQNCQKAFPDCMLPALFVPVREDELKALAEGIAEGGRVQPAIDRIAWAMKHLPGGRRFVSTDFCAPTDSPRYLSSKRGAVVSAKSAWASLAQSGKVRSLAAKGLVSEICVRHFRVFDIPREFRLFIHDGKAYAMSQRFLVRHFRRLVGRSELYWGLAQRFVLDHASDFPAKDIVADIYITSAKKIILIDLNPWGPATDPLMLKSWDIPDFSKPRGYLIVPPPRTLSGDVNVSF